MNGGNIAGAYLGIKLVNGKIKPRYGIASLIGISVMILVFIGFIGVFFYGLLNMNFECIIMSAAGMFGFGYLLLISPYLQNSKNYYMEFENENSLNGFRLIYKGKQVRIQYKIDEKGKIAFANNSNKLKCLAYADNSNMSNFTKYKVINYFCKWLNDNDLMSEEITATFENL